MPLVCGRLCPRRKFKACIRLHYLGSRWLHPFIPIVFGGKSTITNSQAHSLECSPKACVTPRCLLRRYFEPHTSTHQESSLKRLLRVSLTYNLSCMATLSDKMIFSAIFCQCVFIRFAAWKVFLYSVLVRRLALCCSVITVVIRSPLSDGKAA